MANKSMNQTLLSAERIVLRNLFQKVFTPNFKSLVCSRNAAYLVRYTSKVFLVKKIHIEFPGN